MSKEEKEKLLLKAKYTAVETLKHFFNMLNLDPNLFNHIYNIHIGTNYNLKGVAEYDIDNFQILIDNEYLDLLLKDIDKDGIDEITTQLAHTIIHEMIHANRTILIDGNIDLPCYFIKNENAYYLEESFTEALASIIMQSRHHSFNDSCDAVIQDKKSRIDVIIMAKLIKQGNTNLIRWFLTSSYQDYYNDYFNDLFKEDYKEFLELSNKLFNHTNNRTPITKEEINKSKELIRKIKVTQ